MSTDHGAGSAGPVGGADRRSGELALSNLVQLFSLGDWIGAEREEALVRYAQTENVPLVRTEELGLPLRNPGSGGEGFFFELTHVVTPMGDRWELENHYWGTGLSKTGYEVYQCPTLGQARYLALRKVEEIVWWADSGHRRSVSASALLDVPPAVS